MNPIIRALCAALATAAIAFNSPAIAQPARPNIILIVVDDQRHDSIGLLDPEISTPTIDRLATEGAHFVNGFVTTSLCSPSRASILTGQLMRNHGVFDNNTPLPSGTKLVGEYLKAAGYATAFIGKWHMGGEDATPKPGFDRWISFPGQGNYEPLDLLGRPSMLNIDGKEVRQKGYITDELTDFAEDWLTARSSDQPFFMVLSHKGLHAPFRPAERHLGLYGDSAAAKSQPASDPDWTPMWVRAQQNSWHGTAFAYHDGFDPRRWRQQYLRTLASVEESTARIVRLLEQRGMADNTVIIYTSDNGFMEGEKGLIDKRTAYEASMRVPMIVWGPGRVDPGQRKQMVLNTDLTPTIIDLAGLMSPPTLDGQSFARLLSSGGANTVGREGFVYEYYWEYNYPHTPTTFALRTDRFKFIQYHGVWDLEEMFDLAADPDETRNLVHAPEYQEMVWAMRERLHDELAAQSGARNIPYTRRVNQGAVFRLNQGDHPLGFPQGWLRERGAQDRLEHILPDGPAKERQLEMLNRAFKD